MLTLNPVTLFIILPVTVCEAERLPVAVVVPVAGCNEIFAELSDEITLLSSLKLSTFTIVAGVVEPMETLSIVPESISTLVILTSPEPDGFKLIFWLVPPAAKVRELVPVIFPEFDPVPPRLTGNMPEKATVTVVALRRAVFGEPLNESVMFGSLTPVRVAPLLISEADRGAGTKLVPFPLKNCPAEAVPPTLNPIPESITPELETVPENVELPATVRPEDILALAILVLPLPEGLKIIF